MLCLVPSEQLDNNCALVLLPSSLSMSTDQTPAWGGAAPCWGTPVAPTPWSLKDVMSEELAHQLDEEEKVKHMQDLNAAKG